MKLPRRQFLHLAAGSAAVPAFARVAVEAEAEDLRKRWPNVEETELLELKRKYAP
jgi:hypothetical protein